MAKEKEWTGKGSWRRPQDKEKFDSEWDRIFGKKKPKEEKKK